METSKEALFRPNGVAVSTKALMDKSIKKDKGGFPETITIHAPRIIRPGELRDRMVEQRRLWKRVLKARGMNDSPVTEDHIVEGLRTDEKALEGAARMEFEGREPTLVLPSGLRRAELVGVTNKNKAEGQSSDTYAYKLEDDHLWGPDSEDTGVIIAEGVPDVAQDPQILKIPRNRAKAIQWAKNLGERGLSPLSGVQKWVMLSLLALSQGKRIAPNTFDVLNADQLEELDEDALLSFGYWYDDRLDLDRRDPGDSAGNLRVRASVGVDVQKP